MATSKSSKSSKSKGAGSKSKGAASKGKGSGKRELIDTGKDKRFVKRDAKGQFKESDDVGKSLSQDKKRKAKTTVKPGYGDRGDQKKRKK